MLKRIFAYKSIAMFCMVFFMLSILFCLSGQSANAEEVDVIGVLRPAELDELFALNEPYFDKEVYTAANLDDFDNEALKADILAYLEENSDSELLSLQVNSYYSFDIIDAQGNVISSQLLTKKEADLYEDFDGDSPTRGHTYGTWYEYKVNTKCSMFLAVFLTGHNQWNVRVLVDWAKTTSRNGSLGPDEGKDFIVILWDDNKVDWDTTNYLAYSQVGHYSDGTLINTEMFGELLPSTGIMFRFDDLKRGGSWPFYKYYYMVDGCWNLNIKKKSGNPTYTQDVNLMAQYIHTWVEPKNGWGVSIGTGLSVSITPTNQTERWIAPMYFQYLKVLAD